MKAKAALKSRRTSPGEAVRITAEAAPSQPPAKVSKVDRAVAFNTRLRTSTMAAIEARARQDGMTLKQVVCHGLLELGVPVAPADLEDGTPRRRLA